MRMSMKFKCGCCGKEKEATPDRVFLLNKKNKYKTSEQRATKSLVEEEYICEGCTLPIEKMDLRLITVAYRDMWFAIYRINKMLDENDGRRRSKRFCCICRQMLPFRSGSKDLLDDNRHFRVIKSEDYGSAQIDIYYAVTLDPDSQNICEECNSLFNTARLSTVSEAEYQKKDFEETTAPLAEVVQISKATKDKARKATEKAVKEQKREKKQSVDEFLASLKAGSNSNKQT